MVKSPPQPAAAASSRQQQRRAASGSSNGEQPCASSHIKLYSKHRSAATINGCAPGQSTAAETIIARRRQHKCAGDWQPPFMVVLKAGEHSCRMTHAKIWKGKREHFGIIFQHERFGIISRLWSLLLREGLRCLFPNAELNLLSPGSGCPLQAGTGHGLPGRAPGRCGCVVTSLLQRDCGGAVC